jgi:tetratricopeptide (TPR) repeat protein
MRTRLRVGWLLVACLTLPLLSRAQSQESRNVVSVRELSIPPKALRAFAQGNELLKRKDAEASLPHFQRAIAEFANYYEAYYEMGVADLRLLRIADAEQAFRKSVELSNGQYSLALFGMGAVCNYQGKFGEAEEVTRKGLDLDATLWWGHYYLGLALFGLNRVEEAEKSVREALRQKKESTEALRLFADIHSREKNYSALLIDLDEYLKLDPDSPTGVRVRALRDSTQRILDETLNTTALAQSHP